MLSGEKRGLGLGWGAEWVGGAPWGEELPPARFGHTALQAGPKHVAAKVHGRGGWLAKMGGSGGSILCGS